MAKLSSGMVQGALERLGVAFAGVAGPGDCVDLCALGLERLASQYRPGEAADLGRSGAVARKPEGLDVNDLAPAEGDSDLHVTVPVGYDRSVDDASG